MILYEYSETLEKRPEILKHLQAYNIQYTGNKPSECRYFYALKNSEIVGAINTELGWDWVTLDNIYYQNIQILELLLASICSFYRGKSSGLRFESENVQKVDDLKKVGFLLDGIIEATPLTNSVFFLSNISFDIISNLNLEIIDQKDENKEFTKTYKGKLDIKNKESKTDMIVTAIDLESFVGGVHGVINDDKMYVSLLVVLEEYRSQNIGKELMKLLEQKAKKKGVVSIYLGTCEFQAKPFYEKLGYKIVATLKDYPKGYEEYTLVKRLDKI